MMRYYIEFAGMFGGLAVGIAVIYLAAKLEQHRPRLAYPALAALLYAIAVLGFVVMCLALAITLIDELRGV